jgi:hypothetical protein
LASFSSGCEWRQDLPYGAKAFLRIDWIETYTSHEPGDLPE